MEVEERLKALKKTRFPLKRCEIWSKLHEKKMSHDVIERPTSQLHFQWLKTPKTPKINPKKSEKIVQNKSAGCNLGEDCIRGVPSGCNLGGVCHPAGSKMIGFVFEYSLTTASIDGKCFASQFPMRPGKLLATFHDESGSY